MKVTFKMTLSLNVFAARKMGTKMVLVLKFTHFVAFLFLMETKLSPAISTYVNPKYIGTFIISRSISGL